MRKYFYILALFLFASTAYGQLNIMLRAGYGLQSRRDSVLKFSIHPPTLKTIGDSLGFGGKDTVTFSAGYLPESCPGSFIGDCDTADIRYFTDMDGGNWYTSQTYTEPRFSVGHATGDWIVKRIAVTNFYYDASIYYMRRDTLYNDTTTVVIPRGSNIFFVYMGRTSYEYQTNEPKPSQKCQQVAVYYTPPSTAVTETERFNAQKPILASSKVQVPLMLGTSPPRGLRLDGFLVMTVTLVQK